LGGIIVKRVRTFSHTLRVEGVSPFLPILTRVDVQALAYSAGQTSSKTAHLHSIFTCTYGIVFFGTPHHGAAKARLLGSLEKIASFTIPKNVLETDSSLLRALEEESEILQNITDQFAPLMPRFRILFFWEQERTNLGYTKDYIVDEASAAPILDGTERSGIAADHRAMCKFEGKEAAGFRTVVAALKRYCRDAPPLVRSRMARAREMLSTQRWNEASELVRYFDTEKGQGSRSQTWNVDPGGAVAISRRDRTTRNLIEQPQAMRTSIETPSHAITGFEHWETR
jgi:hypothetical protein